MPGTDLSGNRSYRILTVLRVPADGVWKHPAVRECGDDEAGSESASEAALRFASSGMNADDPELADRQLKYAMVLALLAVEDRLSVLTASVDELVHSRRFGSG